MKMKKHLILILCLSLVLGLFGLAGCGKTPRLRGRRRKRHSTPSPSPTPTATEPSETDPPATDPPATEPSDDLSPEQKKLIEKLRGEYLAKADAVQVTDDSVTFTDNSTAEGAEITLKKNPARPALLYGSLTTLWYEAGGTAAGCIGGKSSVSLYKDYIGRDVTQDEGVTVLAESSAGKQWNVESIIAFQPDLVICSTAMSGHATISPPAGAAQIPVIAVAYNDFSDYLKWFKVFCNLTGHPELWESVALKSLDDVLATIALAPTENNLNVLCLFNSPKDLRVNTDLTLTGAMIKQLNGKNIVDKWENASGADRLPLNLEAAFDGDPDMILVQCHGDLKKVKEQIEAAVGGSPVWRPCAPL